MKNYTQNISLDYHPFGSVIPGRSFTSSNGYRYGFNGMEKDDEINSNHYTAEYWEYDPRISRRWNIDPVVKLWESGYATFKNNPILYADPNGLDPTKRAKKYAEKNGIEDFEIDNRKNGAVNITWSDGISNRAKKFELNIFERASRNRGNIAINVGIFKYNSIAKNSQGSTKKAYEEASYLLNYFRSDSKIPYKEMNGFHYYNGDPLADEINKNDYLTRYAALLYSSQFGTSVPVAPMSGSFGFSPGDATIPLVAQRHLDAYLNPSLFLVGGMNLSVQPFYQLKIKNSNEIYWELKRVTIIFHNPMSYTSLMLHTGEDVKNDGDEFHEQFETIDMYFHYSLTGEQFQKMMLGGSSILPQIK